MSSTDITSSQPAVGADGPTDAGLVATVRDRGCRLDLGLLALVPLVLAAVHLLPASERLRFALSYAEPTVTTAFASHYVHITPGHLSENLLGYLLVVPTLYLLSLAGDRRWQFLAAFVTFLLAFPFALSGLNLVVARPGGTAGFSGVLLAFVGYTPIALSDAVGGRSGGAVDGRRSPWLFFVGLAVVGALAVPGRYGTAVGGASLLAALLFAGPVVAALDRRRLARYRRRLATPGYAELALFGALVFVASSTVAFPSDPTAGGSSVNRYTHAMGFVLGYSVTYVTVVVGDLVAFPGWTTAGVERSRYANRSR